MYTLKILCYGGEKKRKPAMFTSGQEMTDLNKFEKNSLLHK